jgi:hypothetical protein
VVIILLRLAVPALLTALFVWALWSVTRPASVFVVRVKHGLPGVTKGTVTRAFLQDIGDVCARHGVENGVLRGVARGTRIELVFSNAFPGPCRQQLRNLWNISGWSAGPRPGRPSGPRRHQG